MRISDWSSDVCSSDLDESGVSANFGVTSSTRENGGKKPASAGGKPSGGKYDATSGGGKPGKHDSSSNDKKPDKPQSSSGDKKPRKQIGRASCRERVCQYV